MKETAFSRRIFFKKISSGGIKTIVLTSALPSLTTFSQALYAKATVVKKIKTKAVVIGSGFGGAVAALRLGEQKIDTLVLERGRRWTVTGAGNTFPTFNKPDRRATWFSSKTNFPFAPSATFKPYAGLIEKIKGEGMDVIVGAGVGGSSLVFSTMMLKPNRDTFEEIFKELDYEAFEKTYYPRVKKIIGFGPIPDDVLQSENYLSTRKFIQYAEQAGLKAEKIENAVDWNIVRKELKGEAPASATVGECNYGMNSGAKQSLDKNYLSLAEKTGYVKISPLHVVTSIEESDSNTFLIHCNQIDEEGNVIEYKTIECDSLFLGAGSIGTTKLLVQAKATGKLPKLNEHVGQHWGNNGDRLFTHTRPFSRTSDHQGGPASIAICQNTDQYGPSTLIHAPAPFALETNTLGLLGMSIPEGKGSFHYDKASKSVKLTWPKDADPSKGVKQLMDQFDDATQAISVDLFKVSRPMTVHPLGGAALGKACDNNGRVKGYQGLYVVDAALIEGTTGSCNPAWTIAALAEYCMENILNEDFSIKSYPESTKILTSVSMHEKVLLP